MLKRNTTALYWSGLIASGIIPLGFAVLATLGSMSLVLIEFKNSGFENLSDYDNLIVFGLSLYIAMILAAGHYQIYNKVYKNSQSSRKKFKNFGELLIEWLSVSFWHIAGLIVLPMILLFIASIANLLLGNTSMGISEASSAKELALTLAIIVGGFFAILINILYGTIAVFIAVSFPVSLISSLIYRFTNLTRRDQYHAI